MITIRFTGIGHTVTYMQVVSSTRIYIKFLKSAKFGFLRPTHLRRFNSWTTLRIKIHSEEPQVLPSLRHLVLFHVCIHGALIFILVRT